MISTMNKDWNRNLDYNYNSRDQDQHINDQGNVYDATGLPSSSAGTLEFNSGISMPLPNATNTIPTVPGITSSMQSYGHYSSYPQGVVGYGRPDPMLSATSQLSPAAPVVSAPSGSGSGTSDMGYFFNMSHNSSGAERTQSAHYDASPAMISTSPLSRNTVTPPMGTHSASTSPGLTKSGKVNKQGKTKRSRMGCLTCRGRKKRCCERRPNCRECERLGLKCNWPLPGMEYRNRSKNNNFLDDPNVIDTPYGKMKVLRGVVSRKD